MMSRIVLAILLTVGYLSAATYTVIAGGGGDYTTIQACATAAVAGDTCLVYAGTYPEVVLPANSGSAGSPITFQASGMVVVTRFNINNRTYITIKGFEINNPTGRGIEGGASHNAVIEGNNIYSFGGGCIHLPGTSPSNDVVIRNNVIYHCGWGNGGSGAPGINAIGDRLLIDGNDISHSADFMYSGGTNVVVRNNFCHDANHDELPGSSEHIDCLQISGNTFRYSLVEGNIARNCLDSTRNCHFFIVRNQTAPAADTIIMRHNFTQNIQTLGSGVQIGGNQDDVPNARVYHNTFATESLVAANGNCVLFSNAPNGVFLNNICHNTSAGGWSPTYGAAVSNSNVAYNTGYSGAWGSPYSLESTYNTLKNLNPLFSNYPADASLQDASPVIGAAVRLTAVASGDSGSGTSLVVDDARFFQAGIGGIPGVLADCIAVGTMTTTVCITAIDYPTNTITLANSITRNDGDSIWLASDSSGRDVLRLGGPNIGSGFSLLQESNPPPCGTLRPGTTNIYDCLTTGDPIADGSALWTFLDNRTFACGSTIVLSAGAEYKTLVSGGFNYSFRLPPQNNCGSLMTRLTSTRASEIPSLGQKLNYSRAAWAAHQSKFAKLSCRGGPQDTAGCAIRFLGNAAQGFGVANNWKLQGLIITTSEEVGANNQALALMGLGFDLSDTSTTVSMPRDLEYDRVLWTSYEELTHGDIEASPAAQAGYFGTVNIGAMFDGIRINIHDSAIIGMTRFNPNTTTNPSLTVTAATEANPTVITATGIAASFGITSQPASCSTGCTSTCYTAGGCFPGVITGATGNWVTMLGIFGLVYNSADSVKVYNNDPTWYTPSAFDGTGKGALTGTVTVRKATPTEPTYALIAGACIDCKIIDNTIDGGQMVVFTGGNTRSWNHPEGYGTVQSGSTATSINLNRVGNMKIGDYIFVYAAGTSIYCPGAPKRCNGGTIRVGRVTSINSTTNITVEPWGPDGIDVAPTTGTVAMWSGTQIENLIFARNLIHRPAIQYTGKGFIELKTGKNAMITDNALSKISGGNWFLTTRNQSGRTPYTTATNLRWANNIQMGAYGASFRILNQAQDDEGTSFRADGVAQYNNLLVNVNKGSTTTGTGMWEHSSGHGGGVIHNTAIMAASQQTHQGFASGGACGTDLGTGYWVDYIKDFRLHDNIGPYGDTIPTTDCALLASNRGSMLNNLWEATGAASTSTITSTWPSNSAVSEINTELAGTCDHNGANWLNCRLASGSTYRGTATDGGDPGADVYQIQDRHQGWSHAAGLLVYGLNGWDTSRLSDRWQVGSTKVSITFPLFNSNPGAGCTIKLYTNPHRATLHADTDTGGEQACNRASSPTVAGQAAFVFGGSAALTANTAYYYEIDDGARKMVGTFRTKPAGVNTSLTFQYGTARTGEYSANPDMSSPTSISSSTTHTVPVSAGAVVYYRENGGRIQTLVNP